MKALMNTKIDKESSVREHIFKIFDHLNTLEIFDGESQINIIFESLPDFFNQFKLNCSMNKINFTLVDIINGHPSVNNVKKTLFFKPFSKKNGKRKK